MSDLQKKMGMAIILITHDLGVVADMCDKIQVMYAGRIVERGTATEIFYNPKHEYTKGLLKSIPSVESKKRLVPIQGNPVDLLNLPKGCAFSPRCSECMKICLEQYPGVKTFSDTQESFCWMNDLEDIKEGSEAVE